MAENVFEKPRADFVRVDEAGFDHEFSPITQRSASTRFDLPQPLGPTMPVSPGSIRSSVGSTKDLKPFNLRRENCTLYAFFSQT